MCDWPTFKDEQIVLEVEASLGGLGVFATIAGAGTVHDLHTSYLPQLPVISVLIVHTALPVRKHPFGA